MNQRLNLPAVQRKGGLKVGGNPQLVHKNQESRSHPGCQHPRHATRPQEPGLRWSSLTQLHQPLSHTATAALALGTSLEQLTASKGLPEGGKRKEDDSARGYSFREKNYEAQRRVQGDPEGRLCP